MSKKEIITIDSVNLTFRVKDDELVYLDSKAMCELFTVDDFVLESIREKIVRDDLDGDMIKQYRSRRNSFEMTEMGFQILAGRLSGTHAIKYQKFIFKHFKKMQQTLKDADLPYEGMDEVQRLDAYLKALKAQKRSNIELKEANIRLDHDNEWASCKLWSFNHDDILGKTSADLNPHGRRMTKLSKDMGYQVKKVDDQNYGAINSYHKDVWSEYEKTIIQ